MPPADMSRPSTNHTRLLGCVSGASRDGEDVAVANLESYASASELTALRLQAWSAGSAIVSGSMPAQRNWPMSSRVCPCRPRGWPGRDRRRALEGDLTALVDRHLLGRQVMERGRGAGSAGPPIAPELQARRRSDRCRRQHAEVHRRGLGLRRFSFCWATPCAKETLVATTSVPAVSRFLNGIVSSLRRGRYAAADRSAGNFVAA